MNGNRNDEIISNIAEHFFEQLRIMESAGIYSPANIVINVIACIQEGDMYEFTLDALLIACARFRRN